MNFSNDEKAWITAHEFFLTFFKIYKNYKFWMTGNKSWDLIKWNANGYVLISEHALQNYFNDKTLTKNSKAFDYGGVRGARCFVAEHPVPTSELKKFSFKKFNKKYPDLKNFKTFFSSYNKAFADLIKNNAPELKIKYWLKRRNFENTEVRIITSQNDFINSGVDWNKVIEESYLGKNNIIILPWGGHSGGLAMPIWEEVFGKEIFNVKI